MRYHPGYSGKFKLSIFSPCDLKEKICSIVVALDLYFQVFTRYEKHRQLILEEIFNSLARLPTSKRNLRNFR